MKSSWQVFLTYRPAVPKMKLSNGLAAFCSRCSTCEKMNHIVNLGMFSQAKKWLVGQECFERILVNTIEGTPPFVHFSYSKIPISKLPSVALAAP